MKKKRMARALPFLLLLLAVLAVPAAASEEDGMAPEPMEAEPPADFFSEEYGVFQSGAFSGPQTIPGEASLLEAAWERGAYDLVLNARKAHRPEVDLASMQIPWADHRQAWSVDSKVLNDHPELFYARWHGTIYPAQSLNGRDWVVGKMELTYYDFSYYGYSDIDEAVAIFDRALKQALSVVEPGMTDLEKVLAFHDYLVTHTAYNWDVATKDDSDTTFWDRYPNQQAATAFGPLVNGDAICQSYSLAYKLLLEHEGIPSILIGSSEMNHVWNGVQLDGLWYQVDTTWDDPVPDEPGFCRHTNFLVSDTTLAANRHHDWEQLVTCSDTRYESGWIFNSANHAIYRRDGEYDYILNDGYDLICLFHSPSLLVEDGTLLHQNPGGYFCHGIVWKDGYLYYIPYANDGSYRLLRCSLDSGKVTQLGAFSFIKTASPDGAYPESRDWVSLRLSQDETALEVVSPTRRSVIARFPIPPALPEWESLSASNVSILGLTEGEGGTCFAGISWDRSTPKADMSLLAAFFRGGRLRAVRTCTVPAVPSQVNRPNLKLVELDMTDVPSYDEVRLFLLREDGSWRPYCPAKTDPAKTA